MALNAESIELIKIMDWVRFNNLDNFIFHVANERRVSPQQGAMLKRMGVLAGVADLIVAKPSSLFGALFIELKAGKGKASPAQLEFLATMRLHGYDAVVCHGAERAIEHIKSYLQLP